MDYIATCDSYGFRKRYWVRNEIAADVTEEERIPRHFKPLGEQKEDLSLLTVAVLKERATQLGIQYPNVIKKQDLIDLITGGS